MIRYIHNFFYGLSYILSFIIICIIMGIVSAFLGSGILLIITGAAKVGYLLPLIYGCIGAGFIHICAVIGNKH